MYKIKFKFSIIFFVKKYLNNYIFFLQKNIIIIKEFNTLFLNNVFFFILKF
jgi:hypothetical protein